jgi:hypothetical protein
MMIKRARWVYEQHYNVKIPKGFDIHHINGIIDDDRIENLQLVPHGKHTIRHHLGYGKYGQARVSGKITKEYRKRYYTANRKKLSAYALAYYHSHKGYCG